MLHGLDEARRGPLGYVRTLADGVDARTALPSRQRLLIEPRERALDLAALSLRPSRRIFTVRRFDVEVREVHDL
jgi:hypothetical protein